MNAIAPRFAGEYPTTLEETRARLLDFADFLDGLKIQKFNHNKWCVPDHTCKTTACGAGWAAILYSKEVKEDLNRVYKKQRIQVEIDDIARKMNKLTYGSDDHKELTALFNKKNEEKELIKDEFEYIDWDTEGRRTLGLSSDITAKLFAPGSNYWYKQNQINMRKRSSGDEDINARQFAAAIRFLAHTPECFFVNLETNERLARWETLGIAFELNAYKKYIKDHPLPTAETPTLIPA